MVRQHKTEPLGDGQGESVKDNPLQSLRHDVAEAFQTIDVLLQGVQEKLAGLSIENAGHSGSPAVSPFVDGKDRLKAAFLEMAGKLGSDQKAADDPSVAALLGDYLHQAPQDMRRVSDQILGQLLEVQADAEIHAKALKAIHQVANEQVVQDQDAKHKVDDFLAQLNDGDDHELMLQEALNFVGLMGEVARQQRNRSQQISASLQASTQHADSLSQSAMVLAKAVQKQQKIAKELFEIMPAVNQLQKALHELE